MSNNINWGSVYCSMEQNEAFGTDTLWSTNAINDESAPTCWVTYALRADTTLFSSDNNNLTTDTTQL